MENEITDAELDAMQARLERCGVDVNTSGCSEARLITALRAARKKVAEYRDEATRCRTLAKHVLEYTGTNGVLIEFGESPTFDTGIGILICAPNLDENNLGEAASTVVKEIFEHVGEDIKKLSIGKSIVIGANGDSK